MQKKRILQHFAKSIYNKILIINPKKLRQRDIMAPKYDI